MAEHTHAAPTGLIGASVPRVEDSPLLIGRGKYVDDIQVPGLLHLAVLRSPYPKARIVSIDASAAKAIPGVEAVVTGADVAGLNITAPVLVPGMKVPPHPILAADAVYASPAPGWWRWPWSPAASSPFLTRSARG